ncbi:glutaredoxin family protein [Grimontia sp. S25]|uniref:Glutaredoxin family protein n=1 Tax=Grimontia sedimenti TaxID=2711294 RepID=A0A6M1RJF9_9GAMM|nr:glutaredoxin family protein [Grimontia sedimenti]
MKRIVLYTSKNCAHCQSAKQFFDSKKIAYRLCDVGTPRGRKEHASLGARGVPEVVDVMEQTNSHVEVLQALAGGQRRKLIVELPAVLIASASAPAARQSAFTKARDGLVNVLEVEVKMDLEQQGWEWQPAKKRPKRTKTVAAKASSRDRFKAATAAPASSGGKVMMNPSPQEAAEAILKLLEEKGLRR